MKTCDISFNNGYGLKIIAIGDVRQVKITDSNGKTITNKPSLEFDGKYWHIRELENPSLDIYGGELEL